MTGYVYNVVVSVIATAQQGRGARLRPLRTEHYVLFRSDDPRAAQEAVARVVKAGGRELRP